MGKEKEGGDGPSVPKSALARTRRCITSEKLLELTNNIDKAQREVLESYTNRLKTFIPGGIGEIPMSVISAESEKAEMEWKRLEMQRRALEKYHPVYLSTSQWSYAC